jgi:hypothetical protein
VKKDPDAVLDYGCDWSKWLDGDTIATSTWTVATGITKGADTFNATTTTVWLSGGTDGVSYAVTNRITTAGGRTDDRTFTVSVRQR